MRSFFTRVPRNVCTSNKPRWYFSFVQMNCLIILILAGLLCLNTSIFGQSGNIDQIRNGSGSRSSQGVLDTCGKCWVNGNAGASNAHYVEGMSIAYRSLLTGVKKDSSYEYVIEYDTYHSAMAIDYLTHYQRLEPHGPFGHPAEVVQPLVFLNGSTEYKMAVNAGPNTFAYLPPDSSQISSGSTLNIQGQPTKSFKLLPAVQRVMTIYNGTITNLIYDHQDAIAISGNNNTATRVRIRFTASKDSVLLVWGGHIASRLDWGNSTATGKPLSAGGISGSPYHMRQISMNTYPGNVNISMGNQDRSLSAAAVIPPPVCVTVGTQSKCLGSPSFTFTIPNPQAGATYSWSFGTNAIGALFSGGASTATGTSVTVVPSSGTGFTTSGSFTLDITATLNGISQSCPGAGGGTIVKVVAAATANPTTIDLTVGNTSKLTAVLTGSDDTDSTKYTYSWVKSPGTGGSLNFSNIKTPIFTATAPGTYTFTVTVLQTAAPNCSDTGIVVVNVVGSAPPCAVSGPSTICPGSTNTYKYDFNSDGIADPIPTNFNASWSLVNNTNNAVINGSTTDTTVSVTSGTSCAKEYTVRIILTSLSGLIKDTCSKTVSVSDTTKPVITCPANKDLQCGASTDTSNTGRATATDNCSTPVITFTDAPVTPNCTGQAGIDRTWKATDGCGNFSTCVQQIRFVDTTKPVITCPVNKNLQCGASTDTSNTGRATATDNCNTPVITFTDAPVAANCTGQAGIDRTWKATDGCGNFSTCVQQIRFVDTTKPVITCPSNKNLQCGASTDTSNTGKATATDNCTTPVITFTDAAVAPNCTGQAGVDRTWKATDGCGNFSTCVQQIRFVDTTKPVITCPSNRNLQCGASTDTSNTGRATATDNCTTPVTTFTDAPVAANCTGKAGIDRTWKATDGCGNFSTCVQQLRFVDTIPPVITNCPQDTTIECDASILPFNTGTATATDNCSTVTPTFSDVPVTNACETIITRIWTATDGCGNSATCTQHIIKRDRTAPIITCPASGNATATDNCTATANIRFFFRDNGTTRTWTAIDESGNQSTCTQTLSNQAVLATNRTGSAPAITSATAVTPAKTDPINEKLILGSEIKVNAYPNPYLKEINFKFISPVSGQATMNLYNLVGQKLAVVYNGKIVSGVIYSFKYKAPSINQGSVIYKLSVGQKSVSGKLFSLNR